MQATRMMATSTPFDMFTKPVDFPDAPAFAPAWALLSPFAVLPPSSLLLLDVGDGDGDAVADTTTELVGDALTDCAMTESGASSPMTRARTNVVLTIIASE